MKHPEEQLQINIIKWWKLAHAGLGIQTEQLLWHTPNGGKRSKIEAARFKAMGVRAGVPDLLLAVPRGGHHALFIELKAPGRRNATTPLQDMVSDALERQGYCTVVCDSFESATDTIVAYLKLTHK